MSTIYAVTEQREKYLSKSPSLAYEKMLLIEAKEYPLRWIPSSSRSADATSFNPPLSIAPFPSSYRHNLSKAPLGNTDLGTSINDDSLGSLDYKRKWTEMVRSQNPWHFFTGVLLLTKQKWNELTNRGATENLARVPPTLGVANAKTELMKIMRAFFKVLGRRIRC